MYYFELEKNNRERVRDLHEQKKEKQGSSSLQHAQYTTDEDRSMANVHERGNSPFSKEGEKTRGEERQQEGDREQRMQEIFHTENAFGRLSLGLNAKGETVLVSSRKMRADIKSTERSERELDEQRSYKYRGNNGDERTNYNKPTQSAFGLYQSGGDKVTAHARAHSLISGSRDYSSRTGNLTTRELLPSKSSAVGETKEITARELKLEHQLAMALERGKKKNEEKKEKAFIKRPRVKEETGSKKDSSEDDEEENF